MSETFDLDAALNDSYKEIMSRGDGEGVPSADATPSVEAPVKEVETPQAPEGRPRAPDGKFAKAEKAEGIAEQTPVGEKQEPVSDQTVTQGINPPTSWSADAKAEFAALPLSVKEAIAKREMEADRGIGQYREKVKAFEAVDKVLSEVRPMLQQQGMTEAQYISNLRAAERALDSDPVKGIQWLAQRYGVNLSNLTQEQPQSIPEIEPLRQQLTELSNWKTQREQAEQAQLQQNLQSEIQAFAADPKNEFFEQVRQDIAELMMVAGQRNQPLTLSQAYAKAVRMNDSVANIMEARRLDALSKKSAETASTKAKDAVKAAGSVMKGNGQVPVSANQTWQQTLEAKARSMAAN